MHAAVVKMATTAIIIGKVNQFSSQNFKIVPVEQKIQMAAVNVNTRGTVIILLYRR